MDLAAQTVSQMVDQVLRSAGGHARSCCSRRSSQDRKGEHAEVIEQLRGQGFVRARIDGKLVELEDAPTLDCRRRTPSRPSSTGCKVRADSAQRLAESFETALQLAEGVARIASMDDPGADAPDRSPTAIACTVCGYSLAELEPRLFSFNNPAGACGTCDGLGVQEFFDPARVVVQPAALAGRRRDPRLGSPQRLLLPADPVARQALPLRHRDAVARPVRGRAARAAVRQRRGRASSSATSTRAARPRSAPTRGKASCRTSSGAIARPSRPRCARNSPSTWRARLPRLRRQPPEHAPRATSSSAGATCPSITALPIAGALTFFRELQARRLARRDRRAHRRARSATGCASSPTSASTT